MVNTMLKPTGVAPLGLSDGEGEVDVGITLINPKNFSKKIFYFLPINFSLINLHISNLLPTFAPCRCEGGFTHPP